MEQDTGTGPGAESADGFRDRSELVAKVSCTVQGILDGIVLSQVPYGRPLAFAAIGEVVKAMLVREVPQTTVATEALLGASAECDLMLKAAFPGLQSMGERLQCLRGAGHPALASAVRSLVRSRNARAHPQAASLPGVLAAALAAIPSEATGRDTGGADTAAGPDQAAGGDGELPAQVLPLPADGEPDAAMVVDIAQLCDASSSAAAADSPDELEDGYNGVGPGCDIDLPKQQALPMPAADDVNDIDGPAGGARVPLDAPEGVPVIPPAGSKKKKTTKNKHRVQSPAASGMAKQHLVMDVNEVPEVPEVQCGSDQAKPGEVEAEGPQDGGMVPEAPEAHGNSCVAQPVLPKGLCGEAGGKQDGVKEVPEAAARRCPSGRPRRGQNQWVDLQDSSDDDGSEVGAKQVAVQAGPDVCGNGIDEGRTAQCVLQDVGEVAAAEVCDVSAAYRKLAVLMERADALARSDPRQAAKLRRQVAAGQRQLREKCGSG